MRVIEVKNYTFGNFEVQQKTFEFEGVQGKYTVSGEGKSFLLAILSNNTGHLLALPLAKEFRKDYTTIALSMPPVAQFSQTAEVLREILELEGVRECHMIGHSNGGVHLQNLISKYPEFAKKIIFSHSLTAMEEKDAQTTNASELRIYKWARRVLKVLPVSVLTNRLGKMVLPKLEFWNDEVATKLLRELCREDMKLITKEDFLAMITCMEEFLYEYTFTSETYAEKEVLILDSPTDKIANPLQRAKMLELAPNAKHYEFQSGGHVPMVSCPREYMTVVKEFLDCNENN
ncbi:Pimeloyl-ACP methyl ester carboxylesterase [Pilibacter termitis]|uniref:Pimeloyl-ACP methyl ester carboxylesterase n=1 Tax=Pilibacter termitis TaxID=263852 RepID=A0A1T4LYM4_9ENTE|nr:alpha/beta hydrolase [Pilibacter termitis]SJZ59767.1 Pimeloyl-ACP methyl ester carboxylesterase [Pilibacter termitis]